MTDVRSGSGAPLGNEGRPGLASAASAFLLLVDSRVPTGGYAHSGGIEAAVKDGRVEDLSSLSAYLEGRLASSGLTDAALGVASFQRLGDTDTLCAEAEARCPSPALRNASRAEGRGLLRAARAMWPSDDLEAFAAHTSERGPMWSVALGVVARSVSLEAHHVALVAAQSSVSGPAFAAIRLLGLDPYRVVNLLAGLASSVDATASRALCTVAAARTLRDLPAGSAPMQEIAAEAREHWEVRLFVS